MTIPDSQRRPDIDWLRVLATLLVVVFHVAMVFNPAPFYHLRNDDLSFLMLVFCAFVSLWHMPLFFVLAGWSLARAIGARSGAEILRERVARLAVPLVAGSVLLMPWIKYVELRSGMDLNHRGLSVAPQLQDGFRELIPGGLPLMAPFDQGFTGFLPRFFTEADSFSWGHLWFVAYLFTFTVVLLPVFLRWARRTPATTGRTPALVWAPLPLLVLVQVLLRPHWPGIQNLYNDWANVAWYLTYLVAGFAIAWDPRIEALVHAQWKRALGIGLATCAVLLGGLVGIYDSPTVLLAGSAVAGWSFVVVILGAARERLSFSTPALRYLAEAALPIYILHQAAIVLPGWWLVDLPLGIAAKFVLLCVVAFSLTLATYHYVVRPLQPLRVLFGMRPLACAMPPLRARAVAGGAAALLLWMDADPSQASTSPLGLWYAEGGAAQVEIQPCGPSLCGRVVWLRSPFDENGCTLTDRWNPEAALRARPVIGIDILRGLDPVAADTWDGGTIYDPTSGRTYRCTMSLDGEDRLLVRGYLAFHLLGRTTTWLRVGSEERRCGAGPQGGGPS